jgi:hypothetical protein
MFPEFLHSFCKWTYPPISRRQVVDEVSARPWKECVQRMLVSPKSSVSRTEAARVKLQACSSHGPGRARFSLCMRAVWQISLIHLLCLALVLLYPCSGWLFAQSAEVPMCVTPVDWVVIVDTSQSMDGKGKGAKKIFPLVREVLHKFVPTIRDDDRFTLFTFDTTSQRLVSVVGVDRGQALGAIEGMHPLGLSTNLGAANRDALEEAYSRKDKRRPAVIVLLSDGHEDLDRVPSGLRFRVSETFALVRDSDVPYFFYASLGQDPDPDLKKLVEILNEKAAGHAVFFDDPGASRLLAETARIRQTVCPPAHLTIKLQGHEFHGSATRIDLGSLKRGETSAPYLIDISSDVATPLNVEKRGIAAGHGVGGLPGGIIGVDPQEYKRLELKIEVPKDATDGSYDFQMIFRPTGSEPVSVTGQYSVDPTLGERTRRIGAWALHNWIWLLLLLLFAALAAVLIRRFLKGSPPPPPVLEIPGRFDALKLTGDVELPQESPTLKISRDGDSYKIRALKGTLKVERPSAPKPFVVGAKDFRLTSGDMIVSPSYSGPLRYHNRGSLR